MAATVTLTVVVEVDDGKQAQDLAPMLAELVEQEIQTCYAEDGDYALNSGYEGPFARKIYVLKEIETT